MTWLYVTVAIIALIFTLVIFRGAPYVPSQKKYIRQSFIALYHLKNTDVLVDIGSGDGIVLRQASKLGARAIGFEINPILVYISRFLSRYDKKISIFLADFWFTNLPDDTTVVYVFSVSRDMNKIAKRLQSESTRLNKLISLIVYGGQIQDMKPVKILGAYCLYEFHSLQPAKPQV